MYKISVDLELPSEFVHQLCYATTPDINNIISEIFDLIENFAIAIKDDETKSEVNFYIDVILSDVVKSAQLISGDNRY